MKWVIVLIVLVIIISFYFVIKRQVEYNNEELKRAKFLDIAANFGTENINIIQNEKYSPVDQFVNSKFVTVTSGIFGKIWGMIV